MTAPTTSGKRKVPVLIAHQAARRLRAHLQPYCERIEIAGSIRRGVPQVSDIEIVAIPKVAERVIAPQQPAVQQMSLFGEPAAVPPVRVDVGSLLDEELLRMIDRGMLRREPPAGWDARPAWGERYKKLWLPLNRTLGWVQLDLFLATAVNWGAIYTIRTGCRDFSKALVTTIDRQTPYKQGQGALIYTPSGEAVPVRSERAYFATIGVPWVKPELRTERAARRLYKYRRPENNSSGMGYNDMEVRAAIRARLEEAL